MAATGILKQKKIVSGVFVVRTSRLTMWIMSALFAALTGVLSQIAVPLGPVPFNLATMSVLMAGGLLGPRYGALSMALYIAMGTAGLPVFSLMRGGPAMLVGPTGGYIVGYLPAALLTGLIIRHIGGSHPPLVAAMAAGQTVCYLLGTIWYMLLTHTGPMAALALCVAPFLIGDALKIALGSFLVRRLAPISKITA